MSKTAVLPKSIAVLIALALALTLSYPVFAQTTATSTGVTRKEKVRERMENRKEATATREAALKLKLQNFKDQKKATAAARISENLNKINTKQTEQMLKHLDKMTAILDKLEARVNEGKPDIKDPAKAKAAIADARASLASASAAVKDQAQKDYTLVISSEGKVRQDAKAVRDGLHTDLLAVRKMVIDAKQSVANAIRVTKSGKLEIPKKEGTPSGR